MLKFRRLLIGWRSVGNTPDSWI
ncbi:Protein of unknown function [Bacillus mycoides]|uniref:Uncharacterized protein n=1 Tax=Bacillus mycoides TaxID=1405 RepID=A0A1C4AFG4_BACMY|nr:Protein of unknown function [Bacillus mycoides]SCB93347.1 Protein of unknown function [Bacillus mycoides]